MPFGLRRNKNEYSILFKTESTSGVLAGKLHDETSARKDANPWIYSDSGIR